MSEFFTGKEITEKRNELVVTEMEGATSGPWRPSSAWTRWVPLSLMSFEGIPPNVLLWNLVPTVCMYTGDVAALFGNLARDSGNTRAGG